MKKRIALVWFSYKNDEAELYFSVQSVLSSALPDVDYDVFIYDDAFCPMSLAAASSIREKGYFYTQTGWNRNGNIRGASHLIGASRIYSELNQKGYDVILKIDPDTVVLKQDWISEFLNAPEKVSISTAFYSDGPQYAFGPCYALKGNSLDQLYHDAVMIPAHQYAFEDYEVGMRLFRISGCDFESAMRYRVGIDGFWQGAITETVLSHIDELATQRVVTTGFAKTPDNVKIRYTLMERLAKLTTQKTKK